MQLLLDPLPPQRLAQGGGNAARRLPLHRARGLSAAADAPVPVVGAGIAGLTAALALARSGRRVDLFERTADLREVGAGLQLSPNALRVLGKLGLLDRVAEAGVLAQAVALRDGRSGRLLAEVPVRGDDGVPYLSIRRADLQAALLEAVREQPAIRLHLGHSLTGARREGGGFRLIFSTPDGASLDVASPVLVAADGVRSAVAECFELPAPQDSGNVAWRMMIEDSRAVPGRITAWLGAGRHAVAYPVAGGSAVNLVLILPASAAASPGDLPSHFGGWNADLRALVAAAREPTRWPLWTAEREHAPLPPGLFLLGDAGHAMPPYAAQGAALAIEDGWCAAAVLARLPAAAASEAFRTERAGRTAKVRARARFHRFVYHLPKPFSLGRDVALRLRSGTSLARDLAWLYDWRPPPID